MSEPVELALVVLELAGAVISVGKRLYELFQDGPKELRAILLETASFKAQLEFVDLFTSSSEFASQEDKIKLQIENSRRILEEMQQLLGRFAPERPEEGRRAAARMRDSITQLLRKPEVEQKLDALRSCRECLNFTLLAGTWLGTPCWSVETETNYLQGGRETHSYWRL